MKPISYIAVVFALCSPPVYSQTPADITKKYYELFKGGKYVEVAEFVAKRDLEEFRAGFKFTEVLPKDKGNQFLKMIFGPEMSIKGLKRMSDAQFFGAYLKSTMVKAAAAAGGEVKIINDKIIKEERKGGRAQVSMEYDVSMAGEISKKSEVQEFQKIDGKWMLLLPEGLKRFGAILQADYEKNNPLPNQ